MNGIHSNYLARQWRNDEAEKFSRLKGRITCAVSGRGCGPCTRIEKTRKSALRIFSRLRDGQG